MMGTVPVQFVQSMISFMAKVPCEFEPYFVSSIGGYIPENRNMLVEKFYQLEEEHGPMDFVLWLDSDIEFSFGEFWLLFQELKIRPEVDIVSGVLYAIDSSGFIFPLVMNKQENGEYFWTQEREGAFTKCDSASLGFVLMRAKALRDMVWKNQSRRIFHFTERNGKFVGEDNLFFELAKEAGFHLWVDWGTIIKHIKLVGLEPRSVE